MGHLDDDVMQVVNSAIAVSFGLDVGGRNTAHSAVSSGATAMAGGEPDTPNVNLG